MNVRLKGLIKLVLGAALTAVLLWILPTLVPAATAQLVALPLALLGLVGAIELIGGVPIWQVAAKWEALPWPARFGLGLLIIAGLLLIFGVAFSTAVQQGWIQW